MSRFRIFLIHVGALLLVPATNLLGLPCSQAQADWSDAAFPIKSHDFGTVAVGAKTEFEFPIHNTLSSDMHIREVRASCGCTTPVLKSQHIPAGETGGLVAKFNTPTFRGKKGATLTVVIDKPFYSEVLLKVDGYIRSDMVFHPGSIEFGTINQGEMKSGSTKIFYAGRSDWQVVDIRAHESWLIPTFKEVERGPGKATYELTVAVGANAPAGFFQDEVIVQTNDRTMPHVPLLIQGNVESTLGISPQSIALGTLQPEQEVVQRLVIRGREPFAIESIQCPGWNVTFDKDETPKKIHLVTIKLSPQSLTGAQRATLTLKTVGEHAITAQAIVTADILSEQIATAN